MVAYYPFVKFNANVLSIPAGTDVTLNQQYIDLFSPAPSELVE
jgi:hypothetical protein